MKLSIPKIKSEAECNEYKQRRRTYADWAALYRRSYSKDIEELTMRIIEWNCRNDDHNPVQVEEPIPEVQQETKGLKAKEYHKRKTAKP